MPHHIVHNPALKANLLLDTRSALGEGAIWNDEDQKLYWVDIEAQLLHCFDPLTSINQTAHFEQKISTVVPSTDGTLLLALKDGVYSYEKSTGLLCNLLSNPENHTSGNRFNDGKCDPSGRLWLGTMGASNSAALYRIDADLSIHMTEAGVTTSNGIAWSEDNKTMYYIDTSTHKVVAYNYNDKTGQISDPYDAIIIPEEMGKPDGCTLDAEGMIWIALWGGYAAGRWNPKTGTLLGKVEVPAKNVTSCAFGGENLDTLYITTARTSASEEELLQCPYSGGLFTVKPGVKGIQANHFVKRTK
ncbi:sugar lactone lactonase YvrE [Pedobacter africanus]|uniref:Sugar lactone lactonase YvrE n=1 Tax=Pedobacter africanus TaxID=151894 RepID=A0ACC6L4T5_9SPHI|nr:SMP-30/gluconolactonase/LRE family protein [Pedobacter africanus]MDR6786303.1 sugar lactone lactonase YvrE [Pedobacter africanus]